MIILSVNANKELSVNNTTTIYQSENNFEKIRIQIAPSISGHSIKELKANFNIINPDEEIDVIELSPREDNMGNFTQDILVKSAYTNLAGQYKIFIKFLNSEGMVGKTNLVYYTVEEVDEPTGEIQEKLITIVDQYNSKLIEITQKIQEADSVINMSNERITPTSVILFSNNAILSVIGGNTNILDGSVLAIDREENLTAQYMFIPKRIKRVSSKVSSEVNLPNLKAVYVDNLESAITIESGAFASNVTINYKDGFLYGEYIANILYRINNDTLILKTRVNNIINDSTSSSTKTYSSSKIKELINAIETEITDNKTKVDLLTSLVNTLVNDNQASTTTTYSSSKIEELHSVNIKKINEISKQIPIGVKMSVDDTGNAIFSLMQPSTGADGEFDD